MTSSFCIENQNSGELNLGHLRHLISTIFCQMVYFLLQHLTYLLEPGLQQLPNALSLSYVIKESDCKISITKETMQNSSNMADA